jgi:hypothetical protein
VPPLSHQRAQCEQCAHTRKHMYTHAAMHTRQQLHALKHAYLCHEWCVCCQQCCAHTRQHTTAPSYATRHAHVALRCVCTDGEDSPNFFKLCKRRETLASSTMSDLNDTPAIVRHQSHAATLSTLTSVVQCVARHDILYALKFVVRILQRLRRECLRVSKHSTRTHSPFFLLVHCRTYLQPIRLFHQRLWHDVNTPAPRALRSNSNLHKASDPSFHQFSVKGSIKTNTQKKSTNHWCKLSITIQRLRQA